MFGVYHYHMVTTVTCNGIQKCLILESILLRERLFKNKSLSYRSAKHKISTTFKLFYI